jgi:hypothetical protein
MTAAEIVRLMPERYRKGSCPNPTTLYLSIDGQRWTVHLDADGVKVEDGKSDGKADLVLKTTEKLFVNMVAKGKLPGPIDIARGRIRTNDPVGLKALKTWFTI